SVFIKTLLEMPELRDGKLSCAVLRGRKLPDIIRNILQIEKMNEI
ncbi:hypothetical protein SAMN03080601_03629, partial [Alkalitalea saponilacus]